MAEGRWIGPESANRWPLPGVKLLPEMVSRGRMTMAESVLSNEKRVESPTMDGRRSSSSDQGDDPLQSDRVRAQPTQLLGEIKMSEMLSMSYESGGLYFVGSMSTRMIGNPSQLFCEKVSLPFVCLVLPVCAALLLP